MMGEIADFIIDGEICQICCCALQDAQGYPVTCNECGGEFPLWSSGEVLEHENQLLTTNEEETK